MSLRHRALLVLTGAGPARLADFGLAERQEVGSGTQERPHLEPAQTEDVPASVGRELIQLPPGLRRAWKQSALAHPVEISGKENQAKTSGHTWALLLR